MTAGARSWTDTCVWWPLHRDDLELWHESAAAVRRLLPDATLAVVTGDPELDHWTRGLDQGAALVHRVAYPDARGFHGPGAAAVLAAAQRDIARATGASRLVRLDADMMLAGTEWIHAAEVVAFGSPAGAYLGLWSMRPGIAAMAADACARHPRHRRAESDCIVDRALVLAAGLGCTTDVRVVAGGIGEFPPQVARIVRPIGARPG